MIDVAAPHKVAADSAAIRDLALQVAETYRALFDSGFLRDTAADRARHGRRVAEDGSSNGSTADVGVGREAVRIKLSAVGETVAAVSTLLGAALVKLHQVAEIVDDDAGHAPEEFNQLIPRSVLKTEVADARARQARRDAEEALAALRRARANAGRERAKAKP